MEKEELKKIILRKLYRHRYIGGRHTELRNVIKGFPPNLLKDAKKAIEELIKEGFLLAKISTQEIHVSLNPKRLNEIREIINR